MTQIVDERLKKMCDECHSHLDKPCAWLSLGNEYCEEIMNIQQELQKKDNNWNELKDYINRFLYMLNGILDRDIYEQCQLDDFTQIMDKIKDLENDN